MRANPVEWQRAGGNSRNIHAAHERDRPREPLLSRPVGGASNYLEHHWLPNTPTLKKLNNCRCELCFSNAPVKDVGRAIGKVASSASGVGCGITIVGGTGAVIGGDHDSSTITR